MPCELSKSENDAFWLSGCEARGGNMSLCLLSSLSLSAVAFRVGESRLESSPRLPAAAAAAAAAAPSDKGLLSRCCGVESVPEGPL